MASPSFAPQSSPNGRIPLARIDETVSARLGPTRGLGNSQPACFNRQVAMYLAARLGRWSTTIIGRFYDGRDHSTVCYALQRIEALRENNPELDALLADLERQLREEDDPNETPAAPMLFRKEKPSLSNTDIEWVANVIANCVLALIEARLRDPAASGTLGAPRKTHEQI
jgi:hypothetical protein